MRIVVLGGGYAGVTLARKLERRLDEGHELVVVDEDGTHLVQHELHRVVRTPALADEITIALDELLERATVVESRVTGLDADARSVELADAEDLQYDVCAVCLGADAAFQVEGAREHATPLKRIEDARAIHERAVEVLDAAAAGERQSVVVAGAGLSGVQVAGELAALARERAADDGAASVSDRLAIRLLEQEPAVAPGFDDAFQAAVSSALVERGVEVTTGARIERVDDDAVELAGGAPPTASADGAVSAGDGERASASDGDRAGPAEGSRIAYDQLVWTGGITGASALGGERPQVDARLRIAERTFGLGDAVRVVDRDGQAVPATAQAAVREADTVAANVERLAEADDGLFEPRLDRFTFDSPGWVVSVGDGAVAQVGPTVVTGAAANALKTTVGVGYLSSVGALREAVDLVNEELGLAVGED